jgi:hypothetical protein
MPSNIFDRAMFKAENKPMKADSGIMQGFDEEGEVPEDEMMEEVSQRRPNSPEILMNNLRGDMRSVDARYQELADMVGEDAAMETPPEVLALLQSQLAQQSMGIGALPPEQGLSPPPMAAGAPPMPTPDMMGGMPAPDMMGGMPQPGAMPQGPEGQMPQGFALGGLAGKFSATATAQPGQSTGGGGGFFGSGITSLIEQLRAQGAFNAPSVPMGQYAGPQAPAQLMTQNGRATTNPEWIKKFVADFQTGQQPRSFADGGIANFSKGVAQAGRNGDTVLAHITPEQASFLKAQGGSGSINPKTGLREFFEEDEKDTGSGSSGASGVYSPEQVSQAREYLNRLINAQPASVPGLEETIKVKEPIYARLLGGGEDQRNMSQARILFDIAQRGLAFAGNVDEQGRPMRGSPVSRFSNAFRGLPGTMAQESKGMEDVNRAARLAALQSSEKEIEAIRSSNIKQEELKRKAFTDIVKSTGSSGFGNSLTGRLMGIFTNMTPAYAAGETSPDQDRVFEASVAQYTQPIETKDERGNITIRRPELPDFVKKGIEARRSLPKASVPPAGGKDVTDVSAAAVTSDKPVAPTTAQGPTADQAGTGNTLWGLAPNYAGIVPNVVAATTRIGGAFIPGVGELGKEQQYAVQRADTEKGRFISALAVNPRFPVAEMQRIEREISIGAKALDNPASVRTRMIAVDDYLAKEQLKEEKASTDKNLPVTEQNAARTAANDIKNFRTVLGVPTRVYSLEEASKLPSGTIFLWKGIEQRTRK